jgi:hypothetical protein
LRGGSACVVHPSTPHSYWLRGPSPAVPRRTGGESACCSRPEVQDLYTE